MKQWYSPRGARRGLVLAMLAAAFWGGWAVAYTQSIAAEANAHAAITFSMNEVTPTPVDKACCTEQLGV